MSTQSTTTEPKELARQARLLLSAASALKTLLKEVNAPELESYRYFTQNASRDMVETVLTCPGVRVAIFADEEGGVK